ncbi:hypothetical protein HDU93_004615, partial [Gonapodya sp. JEL0774]
MRPPLPDASSKIPRAIPGSNFSYSPRFSLGRVFKPIAPPSGAFALFPTEIILHIGKYLPFRLGLPTGALDCGLACSTFRSPDNIAARAVVHYKRLRRALMYEISRPRDYGFKRSDVPSDGAVVKVLLQRATTIQDFNVNELCRGPVKGLNTLLQAAVVANKADIVRILLSLGADPFPRHVHVGVYQHRYQVLPIYLACKMGNLEVANLLVEHGATMKE